MKNKRANILKLSSFVEKVVSDGVRAEISNWVAWCWQGELPGPRHQRRCASAEGGWIPESIFGREEQARTPPRIIHVDNALRVQKIYGILPRLTRQVVRYEYLQRSRYERWEHGEELGPDGKLRMVAVRVGNVRRLAARKHLKIDRRGYKQHVEIFRSMVKREFGL